jgi:hypothetical protein
VDRGLPALIALVGESGAVLDPRSANPTDIISLFWVFSASQSKVGCFFVIVYVLIFLNIFVLLFSFKSI